MSAKIEAPTKIGRYEIERLLGQGGMGRVWLARDTVLGRRVAIKVLRDDLGIPPRVKDELVERMRHEAQAAAAVSHPSIVTLHDMGEDDLVGLYLVFEYVPGPDSPDPESLRDRLKRGPLHLTEVAKLARDLGTALTFAHETGVIHRDVKPENVLFARTGAKIADFGIARIPNSTITRTNTVLGTPAYTAPEALSKGDFGPPSDQFALAATLYEAATAARAFGGEDPIVTAGKVSNEEPPPIHESIAELPIVLALDSALRRGLAKDPAARYASCAELGERVASAVERPPPELLELERTPLSSRVALTQRPSRPPTAADPTPMASIFMRQRTNRSQNIVAGVALVVIVVLLLLGRRSSEEARARAAAAADAGEPTNAPLPQPTTLAPKTTKAAPRPKAEDAAPPIASAAASED